MGGWHEAREPRFSEGMKDSVRVPSAEDDVHRCKQRGGIDDTHLTVGA
jgi:hypothetical protein